MQTWSWLLPVSLCGAAGAAYLVVSTGSIFLALALRWGAMVFVPLLLLSLLRAILLTTKKVGLSPKLLRRYRRLRIQASSVFLLAAVGVSVIAYPSHSSGVRNDTAFFGTALLFLWGAIVAAILTARAGILRSDAEGTELLASVRDQRRAREAKTKDVVEELRQKVSDHESTEQYQQYCWKVFRQNEAHIRELVRWRITLNIEPRSTADKALAFFIHKLSQRHGERWKVLLNRFMVATRTHPPGMHSTFLMSYITQYEIWMVEELLSGKEDEHYVSRDKTYSRKYLLNWLEALKRIDGYFPEYMSEGKVMAFSCPPIEFLPQWYFVARPTNKFYEAEGLEPAVAQLVSEHDGENHAKADLLNRLNFLLRKHAYQSMHVRKALERLVEIGEEIGSEMASRKKLGIDTHSEQIAAIKNDFVGTLRRQRELVEDVEISLGKETVVPDKTINDRVGETMSELKTMIEMELNQSS